LAGSKTGAIKFVEVSLPGFSNISGLIISPSINGEGAEVERGFELSLDL